jgi:hypothetical protein
MNNYSAHIHMAQDGQEIVMYFSRLTKRQAETLHKIMENNYSYVHSSASPIRYGWEEVKPEELRA